MGWRQKVKTFGISLKDKVIKKRKIIIISGGTLLSILLAVSLIPGVYVTGINDYYCGDTCEIPFSICTYKYDLDFRISNPFYFVGNAYVEKIVDINGNVFDVNNILYTGKCWNLTAIVKKDSMTTIKYGFKAGEINIDPFLISEVRTSDSIDRDNLDGTRNIIIGKSNVWDGEKWVDSDKLTDVVKIDYKNGQINVSTSYWSKTFDIIANVSDTEYKLSDLVQQFPVINHRLETTNLGSHWKWALNLSRIPSQIEDRISYIKFVENSTWGNQKNIVLVYDDLKASGFDVEENGTEIIISNISVRNTGLFLDPTIMLNNSYIVADSYADFSSAGCSSSYCSQIQVRYNISEIPTSSEIFSANHTFYVQSTAGSSDTDLNLSRVTSQSWTESPTCIQWTGYSLTNTITSLVWNATPTAGTWIYFNWTDGIQTDVNSGNDYYTVRFSDPDYNDFSSCFAVDGYDYLRTGRAAGDGFTVTSRTNVTTEKRHFLVVNYQPPNFNWSLNSTNSTIAGTPISHNIYWQYINGLSGYIFSWYNGSNWTDVTCSSYTSQSQCQYGCSWSAGLATMKYVANETGGSKASTGYLNITVLDMSAADLAYNTKWFIWTYAELYSNNSAAGAAQANLYIGGTNYLYVSDRPATVNTEYMPFTQAAIINGTGTALRVWQQVQGSTTAVLGSMRRARIGALRLDNLPNTHYNYTFDETGAAALDNVWGDDAGDTFTITLTPTTSGYYYIFAGSVVNSDSTTIPVATRVQINGGEQYYPILTSGTYNYSQSVDGNTAEEVSFSQGFLRWFNNSQTHTIKVQAASVSGTAGDWDDISLLAFRVSNVFSGFYNTTNITETSTTSTTPQNNSILYIPSGVSGDFLFLGGQNYRGGTGTTYDYQQSLYVGGTERGTTVLRAASVNKNDPIAYFYNQTISAALDAETRFNRQDASGTCYVKNSEIIAINLSYSSCSGTPNYEFKNDSWTPFTGTQNWSNVTKFVNSTVGANIAWRVYANNSDNQWNSTDIFNYTTTSSGTPNINFSIWTGSIWQLYTTQIMNFLCAEDATNCEPTNQNAAGSQCITRVCNNGTAASTSEDIKINATCSGMTFKVDDDYTSTGAITLTTSYQQIHGALAVDECQQLCWWLDLSSPETPCVLKPSVQINP